MFVKNESEKYRVWHYVHINLWGEENNCSVYPKEMVVFEGTKAACLNWIKIQFIDASTRLVDLTDLAVEIELNTSDSDPEVRIGLHHHNGGTSMHYHSMYMMTNKF